MLKVPQQLGVSGHLLTPPAAELSDRQPTVSFLFHYHSNRNWFVPCTVCISANLMLQAHDRLGPLSSQSKY